mgnify:CR=1 FL=1
MIKLEYKIFPVEGVLAIAAETNSEADLPVIDYLAQMLQDPTKYTYESGFTSRTRLLVRVNLPAEEVAEVLSDKSTNPKIDGIN